MFAIVLASLSFPAWAGFTLESAVTSDKAAANAVNKQAKDLGHRGRVVRRFREGEGWEYLVRWTFEERKAAEDALVVLMPLGELELLGEDGAPAPAPQVDEAPPEPPGRDWLGEAASAHGDVVSVLAESDSVRVVFTRQMPDGRKARHTYVRRGTDQAVDIEPVEGDVVASRTVTAGDVAWLEQEGKKSRQDLQRTRETLEKFALPGLAPLVLGLGQARKAHPSLADLREVGTVRLQDVVCTVVETADKSTRLALDPELHVRRLSIENEARVVELGDYREVGDMLLPYAITTHVDGNLRDTVVIESVELGVAIADEGFRAPE